MARRGSQRDVLCNRNSLPVNVRLAPSLASFKSALKSYLFSLAFE